MNAMINKGEEGYSGNQASCPTKSYWDGLKETESLGAKLTAHGATIRPQEEAQTSEWS